MACPLCRRPSRIVARVRGCRVRALRADRSGGQLAGRCGGPPAQRGRDGHGSARKLRSPRRVAPIPRGARSRSEQRRNLGASLLAEGQGRPLPLRFRSRTLPRSLSHVRRGTNEGLPVGSPQWQRNRLGLLAKGPLSRRRPTAPPRRPTLPTGGRRRGRGRSRGGTGRGARGDRATRGARRAGAS